MTLSIATWNVNSIKSRLPHLIHWLKEENIDIALLQETKCVDENFPLMELEELGYNIAFHGQKTFNGVAILSKYPIDEVIKNLPTFPENEQARYIEAVISLPNDAIRVASVYVPNGQEVGSDKYQYKMEFYDKLISHSKNLLVNHEKLIIGGDFNVANHDLDVYDPKLWNGKICFELNERKALRKFMNIGLYDCYRILNKHKQEFSWWDYRGNSYDQNKGLRIDYLFASPRAMEAVKECFIDTNPREKEKPSDHTPVTCIL